MPFISISSIITNVFDISGLFIQSKPQAFQLAETISSSFISITDALDNAQTNFEDNVIDNQYFSQSSSFSTSSILTFQAIEFLIKSSFSLLSEKRFKLKKQRSPIEITISEYGELGENDINFDFFIQSNKLKNQEIIILPVNKEVLIYV